MGLGPNYLVSFGQIWRLWGHCLMVLMLGCLIFIIFMYFVLKNKNKKPKYSVAARMLTCVKTIIQSSYLVNQVSLLTVHAFRFLHVKL